MGKKSSAGAKERRTAQRLAERQHKEILAESAAAYTETRLAGIRAAAKAEIPGLGAAMAVKVVDVLCLQTSTEVEDAASDRLINELREELEVNLGDEGMKEEWSQYHPLDLIDAIVVQEKLDYNCEMISAAKAELEELRTQGKGSTVQEPASIVALQAVATAAVKGDSQRIKQQVGPGESKAGPRAPGRKAQGKGPIAQGPSVQQQHKGTLGLDLGGRQRLSKPRSLKIVDELMWGGAQQHALQEVAAEYEIPTEIELYYSNMCRVGQQAIADQIHTKTQAIYDARSAQKMKREKRKL